MNDHPIPDNPAESIARLSRNGLFALPLAGFRKAIDAAYRVEVSEARVRRMAQIAGMPDYLVDLATSRARQRASTTGRTLPQSIEIEWESTKRWWWAGYVAATEAADQ